MPKPEPTMRSVSVASAHSARTNITICESETSEKIVARDTTRLRLCAFQHFARTTTPQLKRAAFDSIYRFVDRPEYQAPRKRTRIALGRFRDRVCPR
jgi:hypothetical protein